MRNKKKIKLFNTWNVNPIRKYNGINVQSLKCKIDSNHDYLIAFEANKNIKLGCNICEYEEDFVSSELFLTINKSTKFNEKQ
tara:strand:- start:812 stop:1057 length:246 start_codon:yes stop_codon:yes gene_type:complete